MVNTILFIHSAGPQIRHLALYHSEEDSVVPVKHHMVYKKLLDADENEIIKESSHLFPKGLPELTTKHSKT